MTILEKYETEEDRNYRRYYLDVTEDMRALFGDVVTSALQKIAEITEYDRERYDHDQLHRNALAKCQAYIDRKIAKDAARDEPFISTQAGNEVYVLFTSGKTACIYSSEWGGIALARKNKAST